MTAHSPLAEIGRPSGPRWVTDATTLGAPASAQSWLTEPGLLTERVRSHCLDAFGLCIVDERHGLLTPDDADALEVTDLSAFIREIELTCDGRAWVFAQTLVPAATLSAQPWLGQLGDTALGPKLASLGGALRDPLEYAQLHPADALFGRAARGPGRAPVDLWARRARYRLGPHCLIVQEVFLPEALR